MRSNVFALIVLLVIVVGLPALLLGYQAARSRADGIRVIEVTARIPEDGGFSPDHLELAAGETVRLRISSPDTVHGLSIPELGVRVEEIVPGKPVEVDVTPAEIWPLCVRLHQVVRRGSLAHPRRGCRIGARAGR